MGPIMGTGLDHLGDKGHAYERMWIKIGPNGSSKKVKLQLNSYEVLDFFNFHIDCFAHLFLHMPISFWPSVEVHP